MLIIKLLLTPLAFALGFLAPLIAQSMTALGLGVEGIPNIVVGLAVALAIGLVAQVRGGWLWHSAKA